MDGVLDEHRSLDYAFIDGHHDEEATLVYFRRIIPSLSDSAVLILDDVAWSEGMRRAWKNIEGDDRVRFSVDMRKIGICVVGSGSVDKQNLRIPMI